MTHDAVSAENLALVVIRDVLTRLSVGVEENIDLIADFGRASG
jgi:cystathionine beta-lyase/cystathionine gamma-synthase